MKDMLRVSEIFYSIQGEGKFSGKDAVFLRLSDCNLHCTWCDTKYTWLYSEGLLRTIQKKMPESEWKELGEIVYDREKESTKLTIREILTKIKEYKNKHVVVTGGEPLLQKKHLLEVVEKLIEDGYFIEIETNGTIAPMEIETAEMITYNVSPKLSNSYNSLERRYKKKILRELVKVNSIFKFVIKEKQDIREIEDIIDDVQIPRNRVYLMAEGSTESEQKERSRWVVDLCKEHQYAYSPRLHVMLWGEKRGI